MSNIFLICLSHHQFLSLFKDLTLNKSIPICKYFIFDWINFYMLWQNLSNTAFFCEGSFEYWYETSTQNCLSGLQKIKTIYFCKYAVDMVFMVSHGPLLFWVHTGGRKSRCFKSTNIFRHTLPAVWAAPHIVQESLGLCAAWSTLLFICIVLFLWLF